MSLNILENIFGDLLYDLPVISVQSGGTGYLDEVCLDDFTHGVAMCRGVDCFKREFVTMKITVFKEYSGEWKVHESRVIYTLFKRYTGENNTWVMCISHRTKSKNKFAQLVRATTLVTEYAEEKLRQLINCYRTGVPMIMIDQEYNTQTKCFLPSYYKVSIVV